jgi:pimeloyl-ACP methyl ester carboxylesterase
VIAVAVVLALYLLVLLIVAWVSVHPFRTPCFLSPAQLGAPQEQVEFLSDGNTLRGWWVPADQAKSVVVLAHGYMMNRSEMTPEAYALWKRGVSCLVFETRAHGRSGGSVCTIGNLERNDIRAAVAFARGRCPGVKVAVVGSSMGSAATALALGDDPNFLDAAVLDSAYSRLPSAILGWWRFLGGEPLKNLFAPTVILAAPLVGFNPYKIDVSKALEKVTIPLLFLHGEKDSLALPSEARRNFEAAKGPKSIVWFAGCGHSEGRWEQAEKYHEALLGFFEAQGFF